MTIDTLTEAELKKRISDLETENAALKASAASFEKERSAWTEKENKLNRYIAENLVASSEDPEKTPESEKVPNKPLTDDELAAAYIEAYKEADKANSKE